MSLYVDSSAWMKRYVTEPDSDVAERLLAGDPARLSGRHATVEVRRNLARLLSEPDAAATRAAFARDLETTAIVELDAVTCESAAAIAEVTGVRALDALHLAAARRVGESVALLTFDLRQAQAARTLGLTVLGA